MNLWWLVLIIPVSILVLLFIIYFFNLDMKLVSLVYKMLQKKHDKKKNKIEI